MRNLKRVLSLALASAMLFGMMVVGAGAADTKKASDLTDMDKVTNKAAVTLLVDLGVIAGKPDGSYAPTEIVNRATMAKLIYLVRMGNDDASAFVGVGTPLTDVKGHWAEGYINYCYSNGLIAGTGANTFAPEANLTTAAAAKMLLVALGYDAEAQGYQNDPQWAVNITRDAQRAGLLESISENASGQLSRDSAAQMIFNALSAKTVTNVYGRDLNGNKYVVSTTQNATTLGQETYKLAKIEGIVTGVTAGGKAIIDGVVSELPVTPDQVGVKVIYYKNSSTNKLISSSLTLGKSTILGTSTDGTTLADLGNAEKTAYIAAPDTTVTYFVNGVKKNASDVVPARGVIIDLIDNDNNGKYDVVRATVKTVATVGEDGVKISKATTANKTDSVTIDGTNIVNISVNNIKGYADLVKDDVILYVQVGNVYYVEMAEAVSGQINAKKGADGYIMSGTTYKTTGLKDEAAGAIDAFDAFASYNTDLTLWLDNNGSAVALKVTAATASTEFAIVLDSSWTQNFGSSGYAQAMILYPDATTEIVTVSKVDGVKAEAGTPAGSVTPVKNLTASSIVAYSKDSDGKFSLNNKAKYPTDYDMKALGSTMKAGVPLFDGTNVGNKDTVFVVKNGDKYSFVTGIANTPVMKNSTALTGNVLTKKGVATLVYIANGEESTSSTAQNTVFFLDSTTFTYTPETASGKADDFYTYDAIVDGKVGTVKVAPGAKGDVANGLMAVKYDTATGYITEKDGAGTVDNAATVTNKDTTKPTAGVMKIDATAYTYTDDTKVFLFNKTDKTATAISIDNLKAYTGVDVTYVVAGAAAPKNTTLTALYISYTPANGGVGGGDDAATGFTVSEVTFTPGTAKVTFSAKVTAKDSASTKKASAVITPYMLANGTWVKMAAVSVPESAMTAGVVTLTGDAIGVKGTTYKFEVAVTYEGETTTINSDAVMIVAD